MAVTTTTFDSLLSGLSSETTNSIEIIMRNTSTGVSKKMSFATFAALLYAWITSNKASDLASVLGDTLLSGSDMNGINADNFPVNAICSYYTPGHTAYNLPEEAGIAVTFQSNSSNRFGVQFVFALNKKGFFID